MQVFYQLFSYFVVIPAIENNSRINMNKPLFDDYYLLNTIKSIIYSKILGKIFGCGTYFL